MYLVYTIRLIICNNKTTDRGIRRILSSENMAIGHTFHNAILFAVTEETDLN